MAFKSLLRQATQSHPSGSFVDGTAPAAAMETSGTSSIEDDLNNLRSVAHLHLDGQGSNWFGDLITPSALETGTQRGINDLNTAVHAVEKKRIVRNVKLLVDVAVPAAVAASGVLTLTGNAANGETVTIGSKTYTFQTVLTDVDGNVLIGASASDSLDNIIAAINLGAGSGSLYAASTTANVDVTAAAGAGDTMDVTAIESGTFDNTTATTETLGNGSWGGATLSGGAGDVVVLGSGELPSNTTAAVGAVTTLGTVVAHNNTFGTATLDEVAGLHALAPKDLVEIVNGSTGDPILTTGGRRIWGLLQSEVNTDGHTINTTTQEVMITFVSSNTTNDDLVIIDGVDIGGTTINYCYRERIRWEDRNEMDFLDSVAVDIGAGAVSVTQQAAFDGQGATAVNITNSVTWDLESAGAVFAWRDDLEAILLRIIEGSAGGTSEFEIGADVDLYDNNAVDVDFASGIQAASSGTQINVGVTTAQIDSAGALTIATAASGNLTLDASGEIALDDVNVTASAYSGAFLFSATQAEVDTFVTNNGSVSLIAGLNTAFLNGGNNRGISRATVTVAVTGGTNAGATTSSNLSNDLGDYSSADFDVDLNVYLNGILLIPHDSPATEDYSPGTTPANGDLIFEDDLVIGDELQMEIFT